VFTDRSEEPRCPSLNTLYSSKLRIEAAGSLENLVTNRTRRHHIPRKKNLHRQSRERIALSSGKVRFCAYVYSLDSEHKDKLVKFSVSNKMLPLVACIQWGSYSLHPFVTAVHFIYPSSIHPPFLFICTSTISTNIT